MHRVSATEIEIRTVLMVLSETPKQIFDTIDDDALIESSLQKRLHGRVTIVANFGGCIVTSWAKASSPIGWSAC